MPDGLDGELLERFVQGDQTAFETLFRQFEADVYRWIMRIVRDRTASDDVLVEAFWRAYGGRARFDASRSFGAWMRRIATNAALDHLRTAHRHTAWRRADDTMPAAPQPDQAITESLALAFRSLPLKLQVVATLSLVEEQPYSEIADALDLPVGTIKSRVFRASRLLRKELARLGVTP
jgi:RNA polymerase sigma-70 factor (ECF subfamily)